MPTSKPRNRRSEGSSKTAEMPQAPIVLPDPKSLEALMTKEMNEMSVAEREKIYEDIHGISSSIIETPEFLSKSLFELQLSIDKINKKPAYDIALSQCREYAGGRDLYLMFLRSTNFDIKQAATRLVCYFEYKRKYFGDNLLGRRLQYSDMNKDDLECLKSGWIQAMPFRDRAGRIVVFFNFDHLPNKDAINIARALWYANSLMVEIEEMQLEGYVCVTCGGDEWIKFSHDRVNIVWHLSLFATHQPVRTEATHFCSDVINATSQVFSFAHNNIGKAYRARNRIHLGNRTEWLYKLMTFGIPVQYAPITSGGQLKTKYHHQFITAATLLEAERLSSPSHSISTTAATKDTVFFPRWTDVLPGSGSLARQYTGNHHLDQIVEEHKERYDEAKSRKEKLQVRKEICMLLQKENVRFLESNKKYGYWNVITNEEEILNKIMTRLRVVKKDNKKASKPNYVQRYEHSYDDPSSTFLNQGGGSGLPFDCCNGNGSSKRARI